MHGEGLIGSDLFAPAERAAWLSLVERALAGAPFDAAMVSRSDDGIRIEPLYDKEPEPRLITRRDAAAWTVVQRVDDPDPQRGNRQALEDIDNGASGLALVFEGAPNAFGFGLPDNAEALGQALEGVPLNRIHLRCDVHPASRAMADHLLAYLTRKRADPAKLSLSFGIDAGAIFAGTGRLRMSIEALQASMPQSLAHFFALGVPGILLEADGRVLHNAGATEAQELGAVIAGAVGHLRLFENARQALVYAAPHIGFALSVDHDQFMSMAKIRALRLLWRRVQEVCGIAPSAATIHAETSYRMMTVSDTETNILRATVAAFAAGCGGADSISVLPHTIAHGLPGPASRRIARNMQSILQAEGHVDFVGDPGSGSGGVEALTSALCEAAWAEFQRIEAEGGILASLQAGAIQRRVTAARESRATAFVTGGRTIVGTTLFPVEAKERLETLEAERRPLPTDGVVFCQRLLAVRLDEAIGTAE